MDLKSLDHWAEEGTLNTYVGSEASILMASLLGRSSSNISSSIL